MGRESLHHGKSIISHSAFCNGLRWFHYKDSLFKVGQCRDSAGTVQGQCSTPQIMSCESKQMKAYDSNLHPLGRWYAKWKCRIYGSVNLQGICVDKSTLFHTISWYWRCQEEEIFLHFWPVSKLLYGWRRSRLDRNVARMFGQCNSEVLFQNLHKRPSTIFTPPNLELYVSPIIGNLHFRK